MKTVRLASAGLLWICVLLGANPSSAGAAGRAQSPAIRSFFADDGGNYHLWLGTLPNADTHSTAPLAGPPEVKQLSFEDRVAYQRAIEEVYWRHRIWPKERCDSKPSLDAVMSRAVIEEKVRGYLRDSELLKEEWQKPITPQQLQAEVDRMAQYSKQPEVLRELFGALGNDPFVIAECLARPVLTRRLVSELRNDRRAQLTPVVWLNQPLRSLLPKSETQVPITLSALTANYRVPAISDKPSECINDTWTATSTTNTPTQRYFHTAVWSGTEMIVWGGIIGTGITNTGGRYNPSTDSWMATSTTNAPIGRELHSAVWTGSEMIIWGGAGEGFVSLNSGGRYDPDNDTWMATSTTNAPDARSGQTAIWTGREMIVWGGVPSINVYANTGGRYNPETDSWTATSTVNAPIARNQHTAVWTGSEMIVWGGGSNSGIFRTGGRYNPRTDTWAATAAYHAPERRLGHTAVWTGSEMIVWGGTPDSFDLTLHTGGIYNPRSNSWTATTTQHAPASRFGHTAIWTGSEMIVWGGSSLSFPHGYQTFNTGGRYNPDTDSWTDTSTANAPAARDLHTAVWTGNQMIVWGGLDPDGIALNTGGRYCAQAGE
jgi:N-acetylneuraminic acid mutarotase